MFDSVGYWNSMADSDNESAGGQTGVHSGSSELPASREQDSFLPIANVSRIMKKALPANAKISKEAKETVQECVSEFISFITGEASDKCQKEKRKTINGDDILWAMTTLGFEDYVDPLKVYLHKHRDMEGEKTALVGRQHGTDHERPDHGNGGAVAGLVYSHGGGDGGGGGSHDQVQSNMMMMMGHHHHHHHQKHMQYGSGNGGGNSSGRNR